MSALVGVALLAAGLSYEYRRLALLILGDATETAAQQLTRDQRSGKETSWRHSGWQSISEDQKS